MVPGALCHWQEGPWETLGGAGAGQGGSPKSLGVAKAERAEAVTGRNLRWWPCRGAERPPRSPAPAFCVLPKYQEKGKMEVANPQNMISMNGIILECRSRPPRAPQHQCLSPHSSHG